MTDEIEFVSNYNDLSTERGFQFEFVCNRCGSGLRTPFSAWAVGTVSSVLDTASGLFGGLFSSAADVSERVRSAGWQKAHDEAFQAALQQIKPSFVQCPRCSTWVCRKSCWNTRRGLCKECAPDVGVEMAAAQASRTVEEAWAHAGVAEEDQRMGEQEWQETLVATCPKCEAPLDTKAKFCPQCGTQIKRAAGQCPKCKAKLTPGAKFCPECGEKVG